MHARRYRLTVLLQEEEQACHRLDDARVSLHQRRQPTAVDIRQDEFLDRSSTVSRARVSSNHVVEAFLGKQAVGALKQFCMHKHAQT